MIDVHLQSGVSVEAQPAPQASPEPTGPPEEDHEEHSNPQEFI
jgi:hypothetical protein